MIGYGYDGWDVVFADGAAGGDVHARSLVSGVMTGEVEPDGRVDPLDGTRPGMLSVMNGMGGNGSWVLSVADVEVGGRMRLEGWSLTLKGWTAVPEPGEWGMAAGLALAGMGVWRRWQGRKAVGYCSVRRGTLDFGPHEPKNGSGCGDPSDPQVEPKAWPML